MKKFILSIIVLFSFMMLSCNDFSQRTFDSNISKYEEFSDIFKVQYLNLEENILKYNRSLETNIECISIETYEEFIEKIEATEYFSNNLLNAIKQLNLFIENYEFEAFYDFNLKLNNILNSYRSLLSDKDYEIFTTYAESVNAATAFYINNIEVIEGNSRNAISKLWKKYKRRVTNFCISVAGGAVLGGVIGGLSTGNMAGVVAGGIAVATYCGAQSLNSGNIVIGVEIKL